MRFRTGFIQVNVGAFIIQNQMDTILSEFGQNDVPGGEVWR